MFVMALSRKKYRFASQEKEARNLAAGLPSPRRTSSPGKSAESRLDIEDDLNKNIRPNSGSSVFHSEFTDDAKRLGIDVPIDVKEASKFKYILMCEEREKKMKIEREVLLGSRVHVHIVEKLMDKLIQSIIFELPSVRSIFEDMPEIDEITKRVLRDKAREWTDKFRNTISSIKVDEAELTPDGLSLRNFQGEKIKGNDSEHRSTEDSQLIGDEPEAGS